MRLLLALMFIVSTASRAVADKKPVEIPLKDVWALDMPGTRPMRHGAPPDKAPEAPLVADIRQALYRVPVNQGPGKGFAVTGVDMDALRNAHSVIVKKQKPKDTLPADNEVMVAFFSRSAGSYVHIKHVERRNNEVIISYHFVQHPE
jgi:hypothetical protein